MDTFPNQSSVSLLSGGSLDDSVFSMLPSTEEDDVMDTGLWSGRVGEGANAFLGSLECGGALLNPGSWSMSNSPGEGLRWNGVGKMELFDEWAGQTSAPLNNNNKQTATDAMCGNKSTLTTMQPKNTNTLTPMQLLGAVKADPEEGWKSSVATPSGSESTSSPGEGGFVPPSAINSPPITLRGLGYGGERGSRVLQSQTRAAVAGVHNVCFCCRTHVVCSQQQ